LAKGVPNRILGESLPRDAETATGIVLFCIASIAALIGGLFLNLRAIKEEPLEPEQAVPIRQALRDAFNLQLGKYPDFRRLLVSRFVINIGIYTGVEFLRYFVDEAFGKEGH